MNANLQGIIHEAFGSFGCSKAYREERTRLVAEARRICAGELERASSWRRLSINWEIEREVRAKLEKKFPRWALYAARERP
jgi:hypothetical protein